MDNKIFQITSRLYNFKIWKRRNRVRFFRYLSMRRKDREVTNIIEILQIIEKEKVLHLALFDADYPYIVPLHYGYEYTEGILIFYMHCAKEGHKLDLIRRNPNVCLVFSPAHPLLILHGHAQSQMQMMLRICKLHLRRI